MRRRSEVAMCESEGGDLELNSVRSHSIPSHLVASIDTNGRPDVMGSHQAQSGILANSESLANHTGEPHVRELHRLLRTNGNRDEVGKGAANEYADGSTEYMLQRQ